MSIQAEIDASVEAFVGDVADLVRRIALESAEEVFATLGGSRPPAAPKPRTASSVRTAARPAQARPAAPIERAPKPARAAAPSEPTPARRSLKDTRRGRLVIVPSTPAAAPAPVEALTPPAEHPMPVIQKIPAKLPRKKRAPPVAAQPVAVAEPAPPTPARDWVVARRPARDRREPGAEAVATSASPSDIAVVGAPAAASMQQTATA